MMRFSHGLVPLFLFLCVLLWSCSETVHCLNQTLPQTEVDALKKIGAKLGKHWDFTVNPCSGASNWVDPPISNYYVTTNVACGACKKNYCHITSIVLSGQNLTGSLPDEFSNLTFLQVINLRKNYLNGTIPAAWASLPLTDLILGGNRITGRIPDELGRITTLQYIDLASNLIEGPLPQSLGNLTNLLEFVVTANAITGSLPGSFGNLKNMTYFSIGGNPITGKIPSFIGNWTRLYTLEMQGTSLEGPFPSTFSRLENIIYLKVSDLQGGDGKFPPLQNMTNMYRLVLRNMSISDELPTYIANMTWLNVLDLSFNALTGQIPDNLKGIQSVKYLFLNNNKLTGAIPKWILTSIGIHIDISYNSFNASSATTFCYEGNVNMVSSYSSTDDNTINPCFRRNHPCSDIAKNSNLFINCGGRKIIVDEHEYQEDMETDGASRYNNYEKKWAISSTGYSDQPYIAKNMSPIVGPSNANPELYTNARLSPISLTYYGLCLLNGNYTVNLHFAEIMFTDDQTYSALGRRFFDVSIQGERVLRDFNIAKEANGTGRAIIKSFNAMVNSNTLEIHLQWAGKGTRDIPVVGVYGPLISAISVIGSKNDSTQDTGEIHELPKRSIFGIVAAGCVLIVLVLILVLFFLRRKHAENNELRGLELETGIFTLRQIKAATRNFDSANKLGEGGFGPVYKGVLPDGSLIAVKQLSSKSSQGNREFINEIGIISALHHPNLVKLCGCCVDGKQLFFIYEFMENNNLANALFGPEKDRLNLDWQTRHRICLGIARGLAYLHEETRLKVVHRDIKATNVLLDKDLNAKISDFGLARLSGEDVTHISTRIAGTIGYMAPEYAMRGYLTDKADVYSFGVVILEIVSGLSNINYRLEEDHMYLLDWANILQKQGRLVELVDKSLGPNYSEEQALILLKLALICTSSSPSLRPTMTEVVKIMEGKKTVPLLSKKGKDPNSGLSTWLEDFEILSDNNNQSVSSSTYHESCTESSVTAYVEDKEDTWISATSRDISDYLEIEGPS